jgi:alginate O-acetyltransferase complex protein AlgI
LIGSSFVFYAYGQPGLLLLLLASISINVVTSYQIAQGSRARRKFWAVLGVALNLGLLLFFKYGPLVARTFWTDLSTPNSLGNFLATIPLPIGISFFTFQGISLVVEVYRGSEDGNLPDQRIVRRSFREHLRNTALFKAFFPQLVAGPIVTAPEFYWQIRPKTLREIDWDSVLRALVLGYFLKMVVADNLAEITYWLAYPYFLRFSQRCLLMMLFGYSIQIFADFAGYSLIAIGWARLFGYRLPINFDFPYLARSFSEFWRRWHISLSNWLRHYLYFPLGGNRKGQLRTYFNLFVVMFLGGLWHGAAWSYAVWGTFHGLALAAERLCRERLRLPLNRLPNVIRIAAVFSFVTFAWLLFKLPNITHVTAFLKALSPMRNSDDWFSASFYQILIYTTPVLLYYGLHIIRMRPGYASLVARWEFLPLGTMLACLVLNSGFSASFIYFQF